MSRGASLSAISRLVVLAVLLAPESVCAQDDWRALRIDGSNPESFQASVASLENALPASQRADFEAALGSHDDATSARIADRVDRCKATDLTHCPDAN